MKKILILLSMFVVAILYAYSLFKPQEKLKIFHPTDVNPNLVDKTIYKQGKQIPHKVGDFKLINQYGDTINNSITENKIFVVDFFFTVCQTICPIMTDEMNRVFRAFQEKEDFIILSHSVTPQIDTPEVLKQYAKDKAILDPKWQFLTGDKKEIYRLARQVYFTSLDEGDGGLQDFIHTENFVLVDKKGRLRGFYDGTNAKDVDRLIREIKILYKEHP
ncbi:MAG: SCO family protein [Luteibaculaceae bacterium]